MLKLNQAALDEIKKDVVYQLDCIKSSPYIDWDDWDGYVDIRFQLISEYDYNVLWGLSDFDTDHRGYWSSNILSLDCDVNILAHDLVEEAYDQAFM